MWRARLVLLALIAVALAAFGWWLDDLRDRAEQAKELREELAELVQLREQEARQREADRRARDAAEKGYLNELTQLRAAAANPVPVVRVCAPATADPVMPAAGGAAASAGGATAAAGLVPAGAVADAPGSRDIGPALFRLIDEADRLSARYRAALAYMEAGTDG